MSNPKKHWSWRGAFGRSTGSAITGAAGGALVGSLGGPLGVPLGAAVFGAIGFTGGMVGAGLGHWWDDLRRAPEMFGSGALYSLVVNGVLMLLTVLPAHPQMSSSPNGVLTMFLVVGFVSVVGTASKSLIDDLHATYFSSEGISSPEPQPTPIPRPQPLPGAGKDPFGR